MNNFKEYLVQEYREKAKGFVAVETKFSHSFTVKNDRKSGVVKRNDVIKVAMKFVDKDLNTLFTTSIVFENNIIPKRLHKSFINISPKELENRFNIAKNDICREILNDYTVKKKELEEKIKSLTNFCNVSFCCAKFPSATKLTGTKFPEIGPIPAEFKGESINILDQIENTKKVIFDM